MTLEEFLEEQYKDEGMHFLCRNYILDGHLPVVCKNILKWGRFMQDNKNRTLAQTLTKEGGWISTVFLGLDHGFGWAYKDAEEIKDYRPVLFETMVFKGEYDGSQERYCTWEDASAGHDRWVDQVKISYHKYPLWKKASLHIRFYWKMFLGNTKAGRIIQRWQFRRQIKKASGGLIGPAKKPRLNLVKAWARILHVRRR